MKLAMAQMGNGGSPDINYDKSLELIRQAAKEGADLIVFPEVQLTEFFPQYAGLDVSGYARELDSDIVKGFRDTCRECGIMAVPNIYLKQDGKCYDASILIGRDGEIIGIQKMVHIAYADKFFESDYYTPSDDGFKVFDTEFGRIGIVVCYDRHYPESIRTEALMGADLILVPTVNTKQEPMDLFEKEIQVQAFQNSVFVAMVNRVGLEDEMDFAGESIIVSPNGDTLLKADDKERNIYFDLDIRDAGKIREQKTYTQLRRTEMYL